jgi:hypothetical protein
VASRARHSPWIGASFSCTKVGRSHHPLRQNLPGRSKCAQSPTFSGECILYMAERSCTSVSHMHLRDLRLRHQDPYSHYKKFWRNAYG